MLTNEAFTQLLNLPKGWSVKRMEISTSPEEAYLWVVHERGHLACEPAPVRWSPR